VTFIKSFVSLVLLSALTLSAEAQQPGERVFRFLEIEGDARSAGLGGSHAVYINPGVAQFTSNPALLANATANQLYLSYLNHIGDIQFGTASYATNIPDIGIFSASIRFLDYGDLNNFDELGNDLGSATSNDLALTAGYAAHLSETVSYGVSLSGIHSSLAGFQSSAISFSGGLIYSAPERETSAGLYLQHAGTQLSTFNGEQESLPLNIAAGVVHRLRYIPVRIHVTLQRLNTWDLENANDSGSPSFSENLARHLVGGAEFLFGDRVRARIGYDYWLNRQAQTGKRVDGAGVSLGFAVHLDQMHVDFSRTSFSDMGSVVQLGVSIPL
jgi:hypothetical protein